MMAHNIKIFFLHEIFDDKILISYKLWRIIYFKGLFSYPNVGEFHLLSYLIPTPSSLFPLTDTLKEVETHTKQ